MDYMHVPLTDAQLDIYNQHVRPVENFFMNSLLDGRPMFIAGSFALHLFLGNVTEAHDLDVFVAKVMQPFALSMEIKKHINLVMPLKKTKKLEDSFEEFIVEVAKRPSVKASKHACNLHLPTCRKPVQIIPVTVRHLTSILNTFLEIKKYKYITII